MRVNLGIDAATVKSGSPKPVIWDPSALINGHVMICGKTGTGKTYTLRSMLKQMMASSPGQFRCHIMDVHGDIDIESASTVKFSEATPYGFNPLVVNPDPDFGGVRKRVRSFIGALGRTGFRLGAKQEACMRNLLIDLYEANGFLADDPSTWSLKDGRQHKYPKRNPSIKDLLRFTQSKLKSMYLGSDSRTVQELETLYHKQARLYSLLRRASHGASISLEEKERMESDIQHAGEECCEHFQQHIEHMKTGYELSDLMKYDSKDVMKSVLDRVDNLSNIGIFGAERPPFDASNPLWRYDIRALMMDEKKLFVSFILESILRRSVQRGFQDGVVEVIILDEAHRFLDDDDENPINMLAKEGRKFGVGLICASQSPIHFSDDFLSNVGTKIVLGIDQTSTSMRKLQIEEKALKWIVSTKRMMVQMTGKGSLSQGWSWVLLDHGGAHG